MSRRLTEDESAAATEIGYVFTFLLGLMFLSTFSIWVWGLEVSTQDRWTEEALEENLLAVSAAVERADEAAGVGVERPASSAIILLGSIP